MKAANLIYIVISVFSAVQCFGMEIEASVPQLPFDTIKAISLMRNKTITKHNVPRLLNSEYLCLPWTISPEFLKAASQRTPIDKDLRNPKDGKRAFPNVQLWDRTQYGKKYVRLSEDLRRTNDIYHFMDLGKYEWVMFDGINDLDKALSVYKYDSYTLQAQYMIYLWEQSKERGKESRTHDYRSFVQGKGTLESMMLEPDSDRFMCSVNTGINNQYELWIKCIEKKEIEKTDGCYTSLESVDIAHLLTDILFEKTVPLGNDTYLGISKTGDLHSIALNKNGTLQCFLQKFTGSPHVFKHISVDRSVKTERGFKPKVALLTDKGELYITHLCATEQPTLWYVTTIEKSDDVLRLYYHEGKLTIIYRSTNTIQVYHDNFETLFLFSLVKHMHDKMEIESIT